MGTVSLAVAAPVVSFASDGVVLTQNPIPVDMDLFVMLAAAAANAKVILLHGGQSGDGVYTSTYGATY